MRRIVLSLAIVGAAALGACSGSGSVLGPQSNTSQHVILTVQGGSNVARVLPGSSLAISAVAVNGAQNGVVSSNNFTWSAALVTSGSYTINTLGQTKACGVVNEAPAGGGAATPFAADFSIYITIDPSNEANVLFTPPPVLPAPTGMTLTPTYPYCVVVSATPVSGTSATALGPPGSITVAVVNPLAPEN